MKYNGIAFASVASIVAAVISSTSLAQQISPPPVAAPPTTELPVDPAATAAAAQIISLPAATDVIVSLPELLTSKSAKAGNKFKFSTTVDVAKDGHVFIPRGTMGEGTVVFQKGAGSFGKSGKIEVEFNWLELDGKKIALTGKHRQEGKGNGGMAVGAVVAAGLIGGALVKGHAAEIMQGQELHAQTVDVLTYMPSVETSPVPATAVTSPVPAPPLATPPVPDKVPASSN
jgi:hypothetical protein